MRIDRRNDVQLEEPGQIRLGHFHVDHLRATGARFDRVVGPRAALLVRLAVDADGNEPAVAAPDLRVVDGAAQTSGPKAGPGVAARLAFDRGAATRGVDEAGVEEPTTGEGACVRLSWR